MFAISRSFNTLSRRVAAIAVLGFSFSLAACGDDNGSGSGSVEGRYNLSRVDGASPPINYITESGLDIDVMGETYVELRSGNTFTLDVAYRVQQTGQPTTTEHDVVNGTYTRNGNSITFTAEGIPATATLNGNSITIAGFLDLDADNDDDTVVFSK